MDENKEQTEIVYGVDTDTNTDKNTDTKYETSQRLQWYRQPKCVGKIFIILMLITFLTLAIVFNSATGKIFTAFLKWMQDNAVAGSFAFIGVYWFATVFMIPGSLLTLGAGFVFRQVAGEAAGIFLATLVVLTGASCGASTAFLLGRFVLRDKVEEMKTKYRRFEVIDKVIELNGLKVTVLLRLSPIIPFNVFNYAMGLTPVKFREYNIAHIGMLPGTLAYCFIGGTLGALSDTDQVKNNPVVLIITVVGTVIALVGMVYIGFVAKKQFAKLAAEVEDNENENENEKTDEPKVGDTVGTFANQKQVSDETIADVYNI